MAYKRLGDLLLAAKVINQKQLDAALDYQKADPERKLRLGEALTELGYLSEESLIHALENQLGIQYIDLSGLNPDVDMVRFVNRDTAVEHCVLPLRADAENLYLAMADPLDFVALEQVRATTRKTVIPMLCRRQDAENAIFKLYGNARTARALEEMNSEVGVVTGKAGNVISTETSDDAAPAVRFVNSIIDRAFTEHASDIHLEPQETQMLVRMRIDGVMRRVLTVPAGLQATVTSRIKVISGMDISEHRIPQDGHAAMLVHGHDLDLRVSSLPTIYGEKIVIRLLDKTNHSLGKSGIGLEGADLEKYNALLKNASGVILIVGPTGSGKSTTMTAMLQELATDEVNVETLEDPVEYNIPGISQCQVNEKTGMTFANGLRALLRQDPDIISVGEIRDGETGAIALRAAITGHLVLSTLHTNDAISAVNRLQDIGIEPYLISAALKGVISQRLVRRLCPECREAYTPTAEERELLDLPEEGDLTFYRPKGCPRCGGNGYKGRRAVFEIYMINREARRLITAGAPESDLVSAALADGFVTMKENARDLVTAGVTSLAEAMRVIASSVD